MSVNIVPDLPPLAPRTHHPWMRKFARNLLSLCGWKLVGEFADVSRMLLVAAPHSSAWDAVWGLLMKVAMGLRIDFMVKKEAFFFPLGNLLRLLGGVPIDRRARSGVVEQTVSMIHSKPACWMVLAPEGTRRKIPKWRSGFWHIARQAKVSVCCLYIHYPEKTFGVGPLVEMSDDMNADIARLRDFYAPYQGKHRGRN